MRKATILFAALAAAAVAACGTTPGEAVSYQVLEANARVPSATSIRSLRATADDNLLIETQGRWYRAQLIGGCKSRLLSSGRIDIDAGVGIGPGATVTVDGSTCSITRIDEIADPDRTGAAAK